MNHGSFLLQNPGHFYCKIPEINPDSWNLPFHIQWHLMSCGVMFPSRRWSKKRWLTPFPSCCADIPSCVTLWYISDDADKRFKHVLAPFVISSLEIKQPGKSQLVPSVLKLSILWASVGKVQAKFIRSMNLETYKGNLMSKLMCRLWRKPCWCQDMQNDWINLLRSSHNLTSN